MSFENQMYIGRKIAGLFLECYSHNFMQLFMGHDFQLYEYFFYLLLV